MRDDVRKLLGDLGQPDFPYRDFPDDKAAEPWPWPLFEALQSHFEPRHARAATVAAMADESAGSLSVLFKRYDPAAAGRATPPTGQGDDVRAVLRRLSERLA